MFRTLAILGVALALAPAAAARTLDGPIPYSGATSAPTGLRAFLLTPDEAPLQYYPRTPSFSWNPVARRGGTYDFQLATSVAFDDQSLIDDESGLKVPAVAPTEQLPWMTGVPYALWAHVRWESANHKVVTPWSKPFGFNMRWLDSDYPQQEPAPEGLIRWKPIEGATAYEVLYPDLEGKNSFTTTTNVADEREFFTFHSALGYTTIHWRVRAIRYISSTSPSLRNGLTPTKYGPWSQTFTTVNLPQPLGTLTPTATISDVWDKPGQPVQPHDLTPGFAWSPAPTPVDPLVGNVGSPLYRVYVFTDDHCVNPIFTGSIVGSPAFAPRATGGPFGLPQDTTTLKDWTGASGITTFVDGASEGNAVDATGDKVTANEGQGGSDGAAQVDLWDSGWPNGRFYWTVVPVEAQAAEITAPTAANPQTTYQIQYHDTQVPQDQCEQGLGMSFGKVSQPVVTSGARPYVSGVGTNGRMIASASRQPVVHDSPLVAWQPAVGATSYEIQLSRKRYPWVTTWDQTTSTTAYVLPLTVKDIGTWWYRVRGINPALPQGAQDMTWSQPVSVRISGDQFVVVKK